MQKISNPEEFQFNPKFISKTLRTRLKPISPKEISNYLISQFIFISEEKIGTGSFAKVYKAIHKPTGETVAVKVINKQKMSTLEIEKTRFQVEIHKRLFHTNIARIYEFFESDEKIYIFMELCQNGQLFNYINNNGPLSQRFAAKIFKQILSALKYLKSQRIFHRDIKCENIMFDRNWNAKLVDFGFVTKEEDGCFSNTFCGSPSYTAPELARRQKYQSQKIDVWCLGVSLYAMIAGQLPFDGSAMKDTKRNIMEINYEMKSFFSEEAKEVFNKIFTEEDDRATIQQLQECLFSQKANSVNANFIDTNKELILVDPQILELISAEFQADKNEIAQSVSKIKLDSNYSLYYLVVQRQLSHGNKVKYDIASPDFQKKKKISTTLNIIKIKSKSKRNAFSRLQTYKIQSLQRKSKKQIFRTGNSLPSIWTDLHTAIFIYDEFFIQLNKKKIFYLQFIQSKNF